MSFVSKYYKLMLSEGRGKLLNMLWIFSIIVVGGILLVYNVQCTITGQCEVLAWLITGILFALTVFNITWGIYKTVTYKEPKNLKSESK